MKVLVATKEGQGQRDNDFFWLEEGEFVKFGFECDGEDIDGKCGCRRSFTGIKTHKAGTTAKVVDKDITRDEYFNAIHEALKQEGWADTFSISDINDEVDMLLNLADSFVVGTILEKRGNNIRKRGC